jgi:ribosomal 30S subunit maturation factor RimM
MQISDLIQIGKIEVRKIRGGLATELVFKLDSEFRPTVSRLNDIFLIFTDQRVRYTQMEIKSLSDRKIIVEIPDTDTLSEVLRESNVLVCLDDETLSSIHDDSEYFDPVDMSVIWNDQNVGKIAGFFDNGAHDVYEVALADGNSILIPDVPSFVIETNTTERFIKVVDLDQFIFDPKN